MPPKLKFLRPDAAEKAPDKTFPASRQCVRTNPKSEKDPSNFVIVSYNILAQCKVQPPVYPYCKQSALKWQVRRRRLLDEIVAYEADIICLQEVDHYEDWWLPQLQPHGYDSVHQIDTLDGRMSVAVFFKRSMFQIFSTQELKFDIADAYLGEEKPSSAVKKGNVGIIVALQPWEDSSHPTALCIANVHLCPGLKSNMSVQRKQILMLVKQLEMFNADFQLPVIICGCFNFLPYTEHYKLFTEGRFQEKPKPPKQPPSRPTAEAISRTQMVVKWTKPHEGDAPIIGYEIMRRAGGNTVAGFGNPQYFEGGERLEATVCRLSSAVSYEFVVAAVSAVGRGEFSLPSEPKQTWQNIANPPKNRHLKHPKSAMESTPMLSMKEWTRTGSTGTTPRFEDASVNRAVAPVKARKRSGRRDKNHVHSLGLSSAYGIRGVEPVATFLTEKFKGCVDYIFYSREMLRTNTLLRLPDMEAIADPDPRRAAKLTDMQDYKPKEWDDRSYLIETDYINGRNVKVSNPDYGGEWKPRSLPNADRFHKWLPNSTLASDHVALRAELAFCKDRLSSEWH